MESARPSGNLDPGAGHAPPERYVLAGNNVAQWRAEILAWYPHDIWAFTEGLQMHNGQLIESTGGTGFSSLRRVHLQTGLVAMSVRLAAADFGEGIAIYGDRLVQLTFRQGVARVYDLATFQTVRSFAYSGEGWGLAFNGTHFVMSDGTSQLTFRDPTTFEVRTTIRATLDGRPLERLNELECVGDLIYANVYGTDNIVEIGPDGAVRKIIDLSHLLTAWERSILGLGIPELARNAVLNGIAWDGRDQTFLVTGKLWPKMFRVRFVPVT